MVFAEAASLQMSLLAVPRWAYTSYMENDPDLANHIQLV